MWSLQTNCRGYSGWRFQCRILWHEQVGRVPTRKRALRLRIVHVRWPQIHRAFRLMLLTSWVPHGFVPSAREPVNLLLALEKFEQHYLMTFRRTALNPSEEQKFLDCICGPTIAAIWQTNLWRFLEWFSDRVPLLPAGASLLRLCCTGSAFCVQAAHRRSLDQNNH